MCSSFCFSSAFSFCSASTDWVSGQMSSATSAAVYPIDSSIYCALSNLDTVLHKTKKRKHFAIAKCFRGTPEGTRTPNPQNRNLMLYPLSHWRIYSDIIAGFISKGKPFSCSKQIFYRRNSTGSPFTCSGLISSRTSSPGQISIPVTSTAQCSIPTTPITRHFLPWIVT